MATSVKFHDSFGPYQSGDRAGVTDKELQLMENHGIRYKKLNTQLGSAKSKSDPEARKALKGQARLNKAKEALESGNYNKMKSALSKLGASTEGKKADLKDRLKEIVDES